MYMTNTNNVEKLNDLLKDVMESEYNYKNCINQIFHRGVRSFVVSQTQYKNSHVHQLALAIQKIGGEIYLFEAENVKPFSFYDDLRTIDFIDLLNQCITLEKQLIQKYEAILASGNFEEPTAYLLKKQKCELESLLTEDKIKDYRIHERLVS